MSIAPLYAVRASRTDAKARVDDALLLYYRKTIFSAVVVRHSPMPASPASFLVIRRKLDLHDDVESPPSEISRAMFRGAATREALPVVRLVA